MISLIYILTKIYINENIVLYIMDNTNTDTIEKMILIKKQIISLKKKGHNTQKLEEHLNKLTNICIVNN